MNGSMIESLGEVINASAIVLEAFGSFTRK